MIINIVINFIRIIFNSNNYITVILWMFIYTNSNVLSIALTNELMQFL